MRVNRKGGAIAPPFGNIATRWSLRMRQAGAPHIYAGEQEQPHHVDEMPIPGGEFEAEMLGRAEMAGHRAGKTHDQEDRADNHMRAVKAGRHEESGAVDIAAVME